MRAEHHLVAPRRQRPAHPQQRVHVARRPDRRHDYFSHRLVIPSRAAVDGTVRRSPVRTGSSIAGRGSSACRQGRRRTTGP
ncbi:hypothetical protein C7S16_7050 [Burkholderia thailandensis]|uniref:Uncharacterized protein n=1 Tax=Burkholderia thailandensis TaxID=57975 RepID=A0AAW9CMZ7_BURTH|nr:hypothetical protein [Burkholderia thailandensis]MDW9252015.1 hypothetical protein [Burkholderia thailandensis]